MGAKQVNRTLRLGSGAVLALACTLVACAPQPEPTTAYDFREDGLAKDGVLARCDHTATVRDEDCVAAELAVGETGQRDSADFAPLVHELAVPLLAPPTNDIEIEAPPVPSFEIAALPQPLRTAN